jgi:hypothetical protein
MSNTTDVRCNKTKAHNITPRFAAIAFFGIAAFLMCSCSSSPVKQYSVAMQGAPRPAEEAIFRASEQPASKPFVKIDGHYFSVGSDLEEDVLSPYPYLHPFDEPRMRSVEVRLLPGHHKVEVAIKWIKSWSLPFSKGRTIDFEAEAGKSYELQFDVLKFNDYSATGNIDWETKVVEVETRKEFRPGPDSPRQL